MDGLNWNDVRDLSRRIAQGEPFGLTDSARAILLRTAPQVGIAPGDAAQALQSESTAEELLAEVSRRISNGSRRLSRTLAEVERCRETGDVDGARQLLDGVLAVEVVPHYQDILRANLAALDDES
ncbi:MULTISPECIES: DUSAM domain-containing protein [Myxococcus]|uniref:DUSAM domain-containing protein n=1 Tax=Myxococcus TaxID=32 RepID=UPI00037D58DC|nr:MULTISPECIES: DUSAM domain-containing protein [Myxococcus]NOJ51877.1 DUSAM domain-containing protein [Myxococcus xanthus]QPM81171.1 DUSAM domain-containing protein [Myxococcus xanthus]QVW70230.1 DUSAM domain-containing protein [Myxococcus xanthus DZ2]UEO03640.1 DUSAM domain-containing protein [Myxococcus xanthus DZ2]UYI16173.1 DUSAM domain-containing protein [Myxococcus xanthus]